MVFGFKNKYSVSTKKLTQILFCLCFIFFCRIYAQNEASNWYFGSRAGITFNTSPPSPLVDSQMSALEGCATVSNFAGELLFYTDGQTVWNRNHQEMLNGTGLYANASSAQAAIIVSKPNDLGIYFVFTVDSGNQTNSGFYYSEIDMSLDNGLGGVTSAKNILLSVSTTETITAYNSESFEGFWVVTHGLNTNEYLTFRVDNLGVTNEPIISATGNSFNDPVGQLKISPQGDQIAATIYAPGLVGGDNQSINVSDFNANTGVVSNTIALDYGGSNAYGLEFSPDGSKLYIGNGYSFSPLIVQFDLLAGTTGQIQNSKSIIYDTYERPIGSMQIGIDEKIYIVAVSNDYLDVIEFPNESGAESNYIEGAISLGGNQGTFGLPQFVQSLFSNKIVTESPCSGVLVNFTLSNPNIDSIVWDFGNPTSGVNNISSTVIANHTYESSGTYNVTAIVEANGGQFEYRKEVIVNSTPMLQETVELVQCDDDMDGISLFNLDEARDIIVENNESLIFTYYENLIDAQSTTTLEIADFLSYRNMNPFNDKVFVRVETSRGCYSISEINLIVRPNQIPSNFMLYFDACDDQLIDNDNANGITSFDFSEATQFVENLFSNQDVSISYFTNELDALSEENEILTIDNFVNDNSPYTQKIWVRIDGANANNCIGVGELITLSVIPMDITETAILEQYIICLDVNDNIINTDNSSLPINTELDSNNYSFIWYRGTLDDILANPSAATVNGESSGFYFPENEGFYTVEATNLITGCSIWDTTQVIASYPPEAITISHLSPVFSALNSINVSVVGLGNYIYKLDSGDWQTSSTFNNVRQGEHTIYVSDILGCDIIEKSFSVVGHPLFFTPNNDGVNDFWFVNPGDDLVIKTISIFNRYGKSLAELKGTESWDGTYTGNLLPSNDYWFRLVYFETENINEKVYIGHFTLKR